MKKLGLILVFLVCFGAVSGFCGGSSARFKRLENDVAVISGAMYKIDDAIVKIGDAISTLSGTVGDQQKTIGEINSTVGDINDRLKKVEDKVFPEPTPRRPPSEARAVPITREIINAVKANGLDLRDLSYHLSMPLILATNSQNNNGTTIDATGAFIHRENNTSSELRISTDVKGRLENYSTSGKEKFEISFSLTNPNKTVKLTFERNEQKNSFDLAYAEDAGRTYIISANRGEPVPQLSILYSYTIDNQNYIVAVQGIPAVQTAEPERRTAELQRDIVVRIETVNLQQSDLRVSVTSPSPSPSREISNAIRIEGRGSLERNKIVNYIISQNPAAASSRRELERLIDVYISEAQREGINHDIAVAQMCYATNFYSDRQLINTRNYAGFGSINGVPVRYEIVNNVDEGVRAHIQHLKWYANGKLQGTNVNVDRRYNVLAANGYLGKAKTLDVLFGYWAPNNAQNYGDEINRILRGLYGS